MSNESGKQNAASAVGHTCSFICKESLCVAKDLLSLYTMHWKRTSRRKNPSPLSAELMSQSTPWKQSSHHLSHADYVHAAVEYFTARNDPTTVSFCQADLRHSLGTLSMLSSPCLGQPKHVANFLASWQGDLQILQAEIQERLENFSRAWILLGEQSALQVVVGLRKQCETAFQIDIRLLQDLYDKLQQVDACSGKTSLCIYWESSLTSVLKATWNKIDLTQSFLSHLAEDEEDETPMSTKVPSPTLSMSSAKGLQHHVVILMDICLPILPLASCGWYADDTSWSASRGARVIMLLGEVEVSWDVVGSSPWDRFATSQNHLSLPSVHGDLLRLSIPLSLWLHTLHVLLNHLLFSPPAIVKPKKVVWSSAIPAAMQAWLEHICLYWEQLADIERRKFALTQCACTYLSSAVANVDICEQWQSLTWREVCVRLGFEGFRFASPPLHLTRIPLPAALVSTDHLPTACDKHSLMQAWQTNGWVSHLSTPAGRQLWALQQSCPQKTTNSPFATHCSDSLKKTSDRCEQSAEQGLQEIRSRVEQLRAGTGHLQEILDQCLVDYPYSPYRVSQFQFIEPKTYMANERTFILWLSLSASLCFASINLITYGRILPRMVGLFFGILSMILACGACYIFQRRRVFSRDRRPLSYFQDKYLPISYFVTVIAVFICTIWFSVDLRYQVLCNATVMFERSASISLPILENVVCGVSSWGLGVPRAQWLASAHDF